jgi:molecular chaperone DnaJ
MDFYIVLGIDRAASVDEVKRAYRRLARQFHPDVNPGDGVAAGRFREIAQAYEILGDPDRRRRYDVMGVESSRQDEPATGFEGFDFSATIHAVQQSTFGDLFAEVFGADESRGGPERGADLHQTLSLSFAQAMAGGEHRLALMRQESCARCAGTGHASIAAARCPACEGDGVVRSARGHMVFTRPCGRCAGSGLLSQEGCQGCGGLGQVRRSDFIVVPVPTGVADGARLRVAGHGNAGSAGGPPGDVYVTVRVEEHPLFRREGDDLHLVVPVGVHEAVLGARVDIPVLDGTARLRVPPGTQTGQRIRLRGRGAPSSRDGRRGDLVAEIRLTLPRVLDERSKELVRQFGELNGRENVREQFERFLERQ